MEWKRTAIAEMKTRPVLRQIPIFFKALIPLALEEVSTAAVFTVIVFHERPSFIEAHVTSLKHPYETKTVQRLGMLANAPSQSPVRLWAFTDWGAFVKALQSHLGAFYFSKAFLWNWDCSKTGGIYECPSVCPEQSKMNET